MLPQNALGTLALDLSLPPNPLLSPTDGKRRGSKGWFKSLPPFPAREGVGVRSRSSVISFPLSNIAL